MTPCKELGYKVGDRFVVEGSGGDIFRNGSIIELFEDDGSCSPLFKLIKGSCLFDNVREECYMLPGGFLTLNFVTKIEQ